jgi:hypothetical protein
MVLKPLGLIKTIKLLLKLFKRIQKPKLKHAIYVKIQALAFIKERRFFIKRVGSI